LRFPSIPSPRVNPASMAGGGDTAVSRTPPPGAGEGPEKMLVESASTYLWYVPAGNSKYFFLTSPRSLGGHYRKAEQAAGVTANPAVVTADSTVVTANSAGTAAKPVSPMAGPDFTVGRLRRDAPRMAGVFQRTDEYRAGYCGGRENRTGNGKRSIS
jgi:hypothetical protein